MTTSTVGLCSVGCSSTGMPRPVVADAHAAVSQDGDLDVVAVAGQGLVDGVVDDLVDEVVQARSPVEPMYMPGRLRTASSPSRTVMSEAP